MTALPENLFLLSQPGLKVGDLRVTSSHLFVMVTLSSSLGMLKIMLLGSLS